MAINADVMEVVAILSDEGFEVLAGELLTEIGRGRELRDPGDHGLAPIRQAQSDGNAPIQTKPIPDGEQLGYAMRLLRLRLVEPIRRLAEAEQIAGQIRDATQPAPAPALQGRAVQISFVPFADGDPPAMDRQVNPGDGADADKLAEILNRIAPEVG